MSFVLIALVIWGVSVGVWFLVTQAFKNSDLKQIRSRLSGKDRAGKQKSAKAGPALFSVEDPTQGRFAKQLLQRYDWTAKLDEMIEQAGVKWKPARLVHTALGLGLVAFFVAWNFLGAYRSAAPLLALVAASLPFLHLRRKRAARLKRFEELFPDSLEFVARSMRAGHAFSVSLEMIHREFQEPLASEFRRTFEEHNLGLPLDVALQKLGKRIPSLDVHFFVSAVMLQKRTGGNLAEILDKLAVVIRERFKLRGKIRAISAHGKMTGTALTCIPLGVAVMMFITNPDYIKFFFIDEVGNYMMGGAVLLQLIGYGAIRKIVDIEV
ncbi:MAG: type II secretion system F family protein [Bryobacteraceae bacterium]|nr:type II secretion system F family protein [Bryobacteraceae bacterium]